MGSVLFKVNCEGIFVQLTSNKNIDNQSESTLALKSLSI